ncbi:ABC transporter permease [Pelagicoccus sp. SDUM812005]|uniref:ABC transporter permease n=1 Tax=Pelagicoccus sp. SDUM812005 TaxID=3041257 RepID=UPI00280D0336|nr:ABC transporter permease [Pelagicoccus sp. SDUM812005]MDQ8182939.1 ABC transporter permease [Pelagicoccus sp. SDUM812005]
MEYLDKLKGTANAVEFAKRNGIYVVLLLLVFFFSIASENFLVSNNLLNVARQVSMLGIAAVGFAFVLLLGGIDLSVGSNITLVNIVGGWCMVNAGLNPVLAIGLALSMATFIGFLNGWIIANINMPPLIVTLAMMIIVEGLAYLICKGLPIYGFPASFAIIGQGYLGPIPIPVIIMIVILAIGAFILNKTYFGRYFYAVGGNEEAAKLSGIKVKNVKYLVYSLSGFFAGLAGIVILSRTNSAQVLAGKGLEFDILTACVLGGVSVTGGFGRISNVVAGVLILGVLSNGLVLMNVTQFSQMVIKGVVLMVAVAFDCLQHRKAH